MPWSDGNKSCVKCKKAIKGTETVLVCGLWCRKSFHNQCLGLSNSEARAVTGSKVRIKFHCEACEKRLGIELFGEEETLEPKYLENCVNNGVGLLELVHKLLKLTNELSNDNERINSKLDTVLSSNARIEEHLSQSPKRFEEQSEETLDNSVEYVGRFATEQITEIRDQNDNTNLNKRSINIKQMCCESEPQQTNNNRLLHIASDFPEQVAESQHSGQQLNIAERCSSNEWEVSDGRDNTHCPLDTEKEEWEEPEGHNSAQDALRIIKRERSPLVNLLMNIGKTENGSDEMTVFEGDWEKHSASEDDLLQPGTHIIENMENEDDGEALNEDGFEESSPLVNPPVNIGKTEIGSDEMTVVEGDWEKHSASEDDFLQPRTLVIEKMENEDDGEALNEDGFEEFKHEVESTVGGEPESLSHISVEDDKTKYESSSLDTTISVAARDDHRIQCSTEQEASCGNKIGTRTHSHRWNTCKSTLPQKKELKDQTHMDKCENLYSCSVCPKTLTKKYCVKRHVKDHIPSTERRYSCSVCNKAFKQSSNLKTHFRLHTGERPYICSICNKAFSNSGNLQRHLRQHTGERPYSCSICNKAFNQRTDLQRHILLHTGERPFSCSICNKAFIHGSNLQRHLRQHTGERPYRCSICNKVFIQVTHLKRHLLLHTDKRPYSCSICDKGFVDKSGLKKHLLLHTGEPPYHCEVEVAKHL